MVRAMTLVEMMIAIFIFTLLLGGLSSLFVKSFQNNAFILEEGRTALINQHAVDRLVQDIRRARQSDNGSYPVVSGSSFDLVFYADADGDGKTERIHYYLENGLLKKGVRLPSGTPVTYAAGDATVSTVATAIYNTNSEPIFTYYNAQYPGDTTNNPLSVPITVANARLVKVHIAMNIDPNHAPDSINFESFAELRNLNEYVVH
jgi:type II secretory pathway component PulJ